MKTPAPKITLAVLVPLFAALVLATGCQKKTAALTPEGLSSLRTSKKACREWQAMSPRAPVPKSSQPLKLKG